MSEKIALLTIALLFVALVAHRVWRSAGVTMPAAISAAEERELHQSPGGRYTRADIQANAGQIPSEKYRGFRSRHDIRPQSGERLCPVTRTRADPDCTWTIDDRIYEFCCPPCIDELVRLAKERPQDLLPPEDFVQP